MGPRLSKAANWIIRIFSYTQSCPLINHFGGGFKDLVLPFSGFVVAFIEPSFSRCDRRRFMTELTDSKQTSSSGGRCQGLGILYTRACRLASDLVLQFHRVIREIWLRFTALFQHEHWPGLNALLVRWSRCSPLTPKTCAIWADQSQPDLGNREMQLNRNYTSED